MSALHPFKRGDIVYAASPHGVEWFRVTQVSTHKVRLDGAEWQHHTDVFAARDEAKRAQRERSVKSDLPRCAGSEWWRCLWPPEGGGCVRCGAPRRPDLAEYARRLRRAWLNPSCAEAQETVRDFERQNADALRPLWAQWQGAEARAKAEREMVAWAKTVKEPTSAELAAAEARMEAIRAALLGPSVAVPPPGTPCNAHGGTVGGIDRCCYRAHGHTGRHHFKVVAL